MSDDGFHEIQLNGKQLVFLFMAATVVAVVIFLCGVMVGRGVPTRAAAPNDSPEQAALDPTASLRGSVTQTMATDDNAPVAAQETLTYPTLLEDPNPPFETLAPFDRAQGAPSGSRGAPAPEPRVERAPLATARADAPKPVVASSPKPAGAAAAPKPAAAVPRPAAAPPKPVAAAPKPLATTPKPAPVDNALAQPGGTGFVVQVAAVRQRAQADTIARRLSGKGYPAFVTVAGANFRVRVGKFNDRREAETVAARLQREEQFTPWITR
jgi:cell division septation protein DedD